MAIAAAGAAIWAVVVTKAAIEGDQRAWVVPRGVFFQDAPALGQTFRIGVRYENVGQQPALDFDFYGRGEMVPSFAFDDGSVADLIKRDAICRRVRLRPGAEVVYPHSGEGYASHLTLLTTVVDQAFIDGTKSLIIEGCFVYRTFDSIRHSAFCYYYRPGKSVGKRFNICQAGNDAD